MKKQEITDMDLEAFVDNEMAPERREYVLSALKQDEQLRQRYESLIKQKNMVRLWWAQGAREH